MSNPVCKLPSEVLPYPPFEVGPHKCVVEYNDFARRLVCFRHTSFNYSYLRRLECRPLRFCLTLLLRLVLTGPHHSGNPSCGGHPLGQLDASALLPNAHVGGQSALALGGGLNSVFPVPKHADGGGRSTHHGGQSSLLALPHSAHVGGQSSVLALPQSVHVGGESPVLALPQSAHVGLPNVLGDAPVLGDQDDDEDEDNNIEKMEMEATKRIHGKTAVQRKPATVLKKPAASGPKKTSGSTSTGSGLSFPRPGKGALHYKHGKMHINPSRPQQMRVFFEKGNGRKDRKITFLPGDAGSQASALQRAKDLIDSHA
eukprot:3967974-Amphidinium_carterae.1